MATYGGAVLVLFPLEGLAAIAVFAVTAKLTRRASVASIVIAVGTPLAVAATGSPGVEVALLAALSVLVVVRHAGNIARLVHGDEAAIPARGA